LFFRSILGPTDGTRLPIVRSGEFGASPFFGQLLSKQGAWPCVDATLFRHRWLCPLWVIGGHCAVSVRCLLYPKSGHQFPTLAPISTTGLQAHEFDL